MKNLYIDFDGVIMDTITKTYEMMEDEQIDKTDDIKVRNFYQNINWKKLLEETNEINFALSKVKKLNDMEQFNVAILTHVNSLDEAAQKVKFIRKFYNDITIIPVPKSISKTKMVHTKDAILVDDYTKNLIEWKKEGGIGIKFSLNSTNEEFPVINDLDLLLDLDSLLV